MACKMCAKGNDILIFLCLKWKKFLRYLEIDFFLQRFGRTDNDSIPLRAKYSQTETIGRTSNAIS